MVGLELSLLKQAKNGKSRAIWLKVNAFLGPFLINFFFKNMISLHEKTWIFEICNKNRKKKFSD